MKATGVRVLVLAGSSEVSFLDQAVLAGVRGIVKKSEPAKVIANRLCISEHTLRNHLTSIYSKLHLTSRLDLCANATRHSLIKPF